MLEKIHKLQDNIIVHKTGVYAFNLALLTELLMVIVDKSNYINPIEGRLFQLTFVLFTLKVITTKYEWREYVAIFVCCLAGLLVDQIGGKNEILRIFMFVASCKNMDMKRCMKWTFRITLGGVLLLMLLAVTGLFGTVTILKEYPGSIFVPRYCFGLGNPNAFHIMVFALVLLGTYVYYEKLKWWTYAAIGILNIILYFLTDSRTPTIMIFAIILAILIFKLSKNASKTWKSVLKILFLLANLASVAITVFFAAIAPTVHDIDWGYSELGKDHWIKKVDLLLSGRIRNLTERDFWVDLKSWRLFSPPEYNWNFDLGFHRLFYWYGIIPATLVLIVFGILLIYLYRKDYDKEIILLTLVSVFTVVEAHFVSVYIGRCYPLLILGAFWPYLLAGKGEEVSLDDKAKVDA